MRRSRKLLKSNRKPKPQKS